MYTLIIMTCLMGSEEFTSDCIGYNSRQYYKTEEGCLEELANNATNWATVNGLAIHDFKCVFWDELAPSV